VKRLLRVENRHLKKIKKAAHSKWLKRYGLLVTNASSGAVLKMQNIHVLNILKESKAKMAKDGFLILGIFGSYARDENTPSSDVDILYDTDADFFKRYGGFGSFVKLDEIKESLAKKLQTLVDIV